MKKVFLIALLVVGVTTFAQGKRVNRQNGDKLTKEQKVDLQLKRMTTELDLNEKQSSQIKALIAQEVDKREAKKAKMKEAKTLDKKEMKAEMEANQAEVGSELKKILTPEQFSKWEKMREEKKEKMKEKMSDRREKRQLNKVPESK